MTYQLKDFHLNRTINGIIRNKNQAANAGFESDGCQTQIIKNIALTQFPPGEISSNSKETRVGNTN